MQLDDLTVAELREIAAERQVEGVAVSQLRKAELVALLKEFEGLSDDSQRRGETFNGPAFDLQLQGGFTEGTVEVVDQDNPFDLVPVEVDGNVVRRVGGHFGRGRERWLVTYLPA